MLAIISDDTWDVLNMQHITLNSERWDYLEVSGGADWGSHSIIHHDIDPLRPSDAYMRR